MLDIVQEEGIVPTYSFPRNVVSFTIEDESTQGAGGYPQIKYAPQRALELALADYAPGRTVTIDKRRYKSGGIYASPTPAGIKRNMQASYYFGENEYFRTIYICSKCNWFSTERASVCPFCRAGVDSHQMLKPWGFAPEGGKEISHADVDEERTYTDAPFFSHVPEAGKLEATPYRNIRTAQLANKKIIILNKGDDGNGFTVCRKCGAAAVATQNQVGPALPFEPPFLKSGPCTHDRESGIYLGHEFLTDMFMIELEYDCLHLTDNDEICRSATITLVEALHHAVTQTLDIEYDEINVGWIYREEPVGHKRYIEVFFYDNLSSGAGYSSKIGDFLGDILCSAQALLKDCNCEKSCRHCLDNYRNQRNHSYFDRVLGLDLLKWCLEASLPEQYSEPEQQKRLEALVGLLRRNYPEISIPEIMVYPSLLNSNILPHAALRFSDYDLTQWLPDTFSTAADCMEGRGA